MNTTRFRTCKAKGCLGQAFAIFLGAMLVSKSAFSMTPPAPAYVFDDLYIGPNHELVVTHTQGIYRSTNGGKNWRRVLDPNDHGIGPLIDGKRHGLFAISDASIYRSTDTGLTWSRMGTGAGSLTIDGAGVLYKCRDRVEISRDFGRTWTPTKAQPKLASRGAACEAIASAGKGIYVFSNGNKGAVTASMDQGRTWKVLQAFSKKLQGGELLRNLESFRNERVLVDSAGAIYVNTSRNSDGHLYRGTRRGERWDEIKLGKAHRGTLRTEIVAVHGTKIIALCHPYARVLCISDGKSPVRALDFHNTGLLGTNGAEIRLGPNGEWYEVGMYGVQRADPKTMKVWSLGTSGIPDPYTGRVR